MQKYGQIYTNIASFTEIWKDIHKYGHIAADASEFRALNSDASAAILPNIHRYGQIYADIARYTQICPDIHKYGQIYTNIALLQPTRLSSGP